MAALQEDGFGNNRHINRHVTDREMSQDGGRVEAGEARDFALAPEAPGQSPQTHFPIALPALLPDHGSHGIRQPPPTDRRLAPHCGTLASLPKLDCHHHQHQTETTNQCVNHFTKKMVSELTLSHNYGPLAGI